MTKNIHFEKLKNDCPQIQPFLVAPKDPTSKWGRIICQWNEKRDNRLIGKCHLYAARINLITGDVYFDDQENLILKKSFLFILARPGLTVLKTIYHALIPVSLINEIYKTVIKGRKKGLNGLQITWEAFKNAGKNLLDIVRTPLYGLALTILAVLGAVVGLFSTEGMLDISALAGKIHRSMYWGKCVNHPGLCFTSLCNVKQKNDHWDQQDDDNVEYGSDHYSLNTLNNFAATQVSYKRQEGFPNDAVYTSPAFYDFSPEDQKRFKPPNSPPFSNATPPANGN